MAVCAKCGAEIEEGKYLCESCENEEASQKQTEAYLDNLLDNIQEGSALELLQKKGKLKETAPLEEIGEAEGMSEDFATLLGESSLEGVMDEKMGEDNIRDNEAVEEEELDLSDMDGLDDIDFDAMEGLDDINFDDMEDLSGIEPEGIKEAAGETEAEEAPEAFSDIGIEPEGTKEAFGEAEAEEAPEAFSDIGIEPEGTKEAVDEAEAEAMMEELGLDELFSEELSGEAPEEEAVKAAEDDASEETDNMDDMLDQLLAELDDGGSVGETEPEEEAVSDEDLGKMMEDYKGSDEELQDLDDLLSLMEDEGSSDAAASEEETSDSEEADVLEADEELSDTGLLELEDFDDEEAEGLLDFDEGIAAMTEEEAMDEDALAVLMEEEISIPVPEEAPKKKKGFLSKVFGNVIDDDIAKKELEERKAEEEAEAKKAEEKKEKAESDAAKKAEKDEQKAQKAAEKKEKKELAKKEKAEKKAEKQAKKQAAREEAEKEAELEVVGKLNKVGVGIVAALGIAFLAFVTLGTQSFSYASAMKDAREYYDNKKYTKAYEELLGIDVKEKDQEFYDKVITIMKVNRQIDSYSTYKSLKRFPEALDALLKGLQRYDSNYEAALDLEIEEDMDGCRETILDSLSDEFDLTEEDAYAIVNSASQDEYNEQVVDIVVRQMEKVMNPAD